MTEAQKNIVEVPRRLPISKLATVYFAKQQAITDWQKFQVAYAIPDPRRPAKSKRPRWGQPGRGRRRAERQQARAAERARNEVRQMMRPVDIKRIQPPVDAWKKWDELVAQQFRDALGVTQNHAADAMAYAMTKAVG